MKIAFLNGSLAPGKDGVGDYTASLAACCTALGHPCAMIALNDRHATAREESGRPCAGGTVPVLRLPATLPWSGRIDAAIAFCERFAPDWISLQFVGYGFQEKGLVAALPGRLRRIVDARPLHVMMHELWSSERFSVSPKRWLVGRTQRAFALRMLEMLRPATLHVTLPVNVELLAVAGIRAELLPLFGSIPIVELSGSEPLAAQVRGGGAMVGGFFGSLYPQWQPEPLMGILQKAARQRGQPLRIVSAGRLGADSRRRWAEFCAAYAPAVEFVTLGEQPPEALSQLFQLLDFGLASASWRVLGKSSAVAAMLDHGLPVVVLPDADTGFRWDAATAGDPSLIHRCDEQLAAKLVAGLPKTPPRSSAPRVASAFLSRLADPPHGADKPCGTC